MTILIAFVIALIVALAFSPREKGATVAPLIVFFLVLFFAALAGGYWITPFGPMIWGIAWMPLVFIVLIVAILFAAPSPYERTRTKATEVQQSATGLAAVGALTWIILFTLLIAILAGIYRGGLH
jgi:magnesium-transporting ATPase (P-type)